MIGFRSALLAAGTLCMIAGAASAQTTNDHAASPGTEDFGHPVMDRMIVVHAILDEFEGRVSDGPPELRWSGQAWIGTDYDKFWIKTEGFRRADGSIDDGRHEFLYDRAISTYWDLQAGIRADIDSKPSRSWGAFGIHGLAPLFFDIDATGYVSDAGHFAAKLEGSYDLLITQRLILEPQIELNFYSKTDSARLVGSGLSDLDAGLRLRYEFSRKIAPYIGFAYEEKFGRTASLAREAGEDSAGARFVFGLRVWF
jgi:copper resistance protein B